MSFQDVRPGQGRRAMSSSSGGGYSTYNGGNVNSTGTRRAVAQSSRNGVVNQGTRVGGGFASMGPMRTGGIGVSGPSPGTSQNGGGAGFGPSGRHIPPAAGSRMIGSSGGGKLGDYLMSFSQNVSMLHGLVQQLSTNRDTAEIRGQCRCQMEVIDELREKIKTELSLLQQQAEGASRLEAARLGAMNSKLTKDFNRVNAIALDLGRQAERRMAEVENERRRQVEEDERRAREAFEGDEGGVSGGRQQTGMMEAQQRRQRLQAEEEAVNTAIIQETEEELQQINRSLYKVNEIYRDLASIVDQQQESVDMIESNTEGAHARAQEGLAQVQKANEYQSGCVVS